MKSMRTVSFEEWMSDLRHLAPEFGYFWNELETEDWRDFFEDGLTPRDAFIADLAQG